MLKKYDGTNWNTASYGKYFSGTEQFTNFPLVIRSLDQSVQSYTIKGNTSVSGNPSPQNPITIEGVGDKTANLLNPNWIENGYGISNVDGLPLVAPNRIATTSPIPIPTTATAISISFSAANNIYMIYSIFRNGTLIERKASQVSGVTITTDNIDEMYICFYASDSSTITKNDVSSIMVNVGLGALPFVPYGYKITVLKDLSPLTPIYLGDVQTTRQIVKRELTGEEQWGMAGTGDSIYYQLNIGALNSVVTGASLSSHFQNAQISTSTTDVGVRVYNSSGTNLAALNIRPENVSTDYNTAAKFKQWLADQNAAGTPVIIYYVRSTAITSTVNEPLMKIDEYTDSIDSTQAGVTIPTTNGTATIDVDTIVKPSEVSLTYNGKHLNKSKKYNGNNWT